MTEQTDLDLNDAAHAALQSEKLLFGSVVEMPQGTENRALLVWQTTPAAQTVQNAQFIEIADDAAWQRYTQARIRIEEGFGVTALGAAQMVAHMRASAKLHPIRWYFLRTGGAEIGAIGRYIFEHASKRYMRLQDVDVFPEYRGHGYGNLLLAAAQSLAVTQDSDFLIVGADEDDWPLAWYMRKGFVRVATVRKPKHPALELRS
ncbi:MAG: GNAT family N-acetyltransferase [Burkholderiaceae bacterium]